MLMKWMLILNYSLHILFHYMTASFTHAFTTWTCFIIKFNIAEVKHAEHHRVPCHHSTQHRLAPWSLVLLLPTVRTPGTFLFVPLCGSDVIVHWIVVTCPRFRHESSPSWLLVVVTVVFAHLSFFSLHDQAYGGAMLGSSGVLRSF
jgi:hypothetical protein